VLVCTCIDGLIQQEASPANINTLSPEPDDDDDDDDDINNNDVDDDRPSYATSPLNATGGFEELTLPDLTHDAGDTFNSTGSFYSE